MTTFKKGDIVRRKETHKNDWWSSKRDCNYVVDSEITMESMVIIPVDDDTGEQWLSVYINSMELVELVESIEIIKETYLSLLQVQDWAWRTKNQHIYIKLRNTIAEHDGKSISEVQEEYETMAFD